MKSWIVLVSLIGVTSAAMAVEVPVNLKNLLPVGKEEVSLHGNTFDRRECSFDVFSARKRFSADLTIYYGYSSPDPARSGRFQLGEGFDLVSEKNVVDTVNYQILSHNQESDKDNRSTLKLYRQKGKLRAVQLLVEEEGRFGFNTVTKETCYLKVR
jgi:hypothetical protein